MNVLGQLDKLEERLESVNERLDEQDFEGARKEAMGLSEMMDCALCKNIENGVLGGVMFAAGMTPRGQERRSQEVQREIERFITAELPEARDRIAELEAELEEAEA